MARSFKKCLAAAAICYPKDKQYSAGRRLRFALQLLFLHRGKIDGLERFFAISALRRAIMAAPGFRAHIYIQQVLACFYRGSTRLQRSQYLDSHFRHLERTHRHDIVGQMYGQTLAPVTMQEQESSLGVRLDCHPGILKEGLLALSITLNGVTLYRISFWIMEHAGAPAICIGALQGGKSTLEGNHAFTRQFWGLRPQNMALAALRSYARAAGVAQLLTFPKHRLKSRKICTQTDLDQFWSEQGAQAVAGSPYIQLSTQCPQRELADVASRKRSAYRKRQHFLDRARGVMAERFD